MYKMLCGFAECRFFNLALLIMMVKFMKSVTLFFFALFFLFQGILGQGRHGVRYKDISRYLVCPGIPEYQLPETKLQVRIGIMFNEPDIAYNWTQLLIDANFELNDDEPLPGQLLFPYVPLAMEVYDQVVGINNDSSILPFHHLCLFYIFTPRIYEEVAVANNFIYATNGVYLIINLLKQESQHEASTKLMTYFSSLISIPPDKWKNTNVSSYNGTERLPQLFLGEELAQEKQCLRKIGVNMDMLPSKYSLYHAVYVFLQEMKWRKVGVFTSCQDCINLWPSDEENVELVMYYPDDFLKSFSEISNNYNIYIFLEPLDSFLKMLLEFNVRRTTNLRSFTWIIPYFDPHFEYHFRDYLTTLFTVEEQGKIQYELRGSFAIFPIEHCVPTCTSHNESHDESHPLYVDYLFDSLSYFAKLADVFLEEKASRTAENISQTIISSSDKTDINETFTNFSIEGLTGKVSFDNDCHRRSNFFIVLNFIPLQQDSEVQLETRGFVYTELNNDTVFFRLPNGSLSKDVVTLTFYDGTSNIPPDVVNGEFKRSNLVVAVVLVASSLLYLTIAALNVLFVYFIDTFTGLYNECWLHKVKNVRLLNGDLKDTTIVSLLQATEQRFQDAEFGEINNKIVKIHKLEMVKTSLTRKVREQVLQILEFNHDNICPFLGGIYKDSSIKGVMYEYCSRGSLYGILRNPKVIFNPQVRILFAIDIVNGLNYLHERKMTHGRLTSHNCVIDNLWKLKLTDYALDAFHSIKNKKATPSFYDNFHRDDFQYDRIDDDNDSDDDKRNTQKYSYDIYKFGLVLKELSSRQSILDGMTVWEYDEDVSLKIQMLIMNCIAQTETVIVEEIMTTLQKIVSKYGLLHDATGVAEVNSRHFESYIEISKTMLSFEKQTRDQIMSKYIPGTVVDALRKEADVPLIEWKNVAIMSITITNLERDYDLKEMATAIRTVDVILYSITTLAKIDRVYSSGALWIYMCDSIEDQSALLYFIKIAANISFALDDSQYSVPYSIAIHCDRLISGTIKVDTLSYVALGKIIPSVLNLLHVTPESGTTVSEYVQQLLPLSYPTSYLSYIIEEDGSTLPCHTLYAIPDVSASKVSVSVLSDSTSLKSQMFPYFEGSPATDVEGTVRNKRIVSAERKSSIQQWDQFALEL